MNTINRNQNGQFLKGTHWRTPQRFRGRDWLHEEYVVKGRSAEDIAKEFGVSAPAITFWLKKHGIPRRSTSETRKLKKWGASGPDNPMWNRSGELNPHWRGGITPERQAFYASREWKVASKAVWKRDKGTCRRCGCEYNFQAGISFHVHHIQSFADVELRAEPSNLVIVCESCHNFIHSRKNICREFLPEE